MQMGREKSARREGKWAKARCTRALVHSIFGSAGKVGRKEPNPTQAPPEPAPLRSQNGSGRSYAIRAVHDKQDSHTFQQNPHGRKGI